MNWKHRNRQRTQNACLQDAMSASPWQPRDFPNYSLDRQITDARREMGEARWAELQAEWNTNP